MALLTPAARLKTNGDTFYLPVPNGGVYFRNNVGTFRMEGEAIDRWIEKLLPMFNGEYTMEQLTDGMEDPHRNRIYEIAEALVNKGFVRDVSRDLPHRLKDDIVRKYAGQIAFLDSFGSSGAYRFQSYRQSSVLAAGSGPLFVSLVGALLESGLPQFSMLITDESTTNRERLAELAEHARATDPEVAIEEVEWPKEGSDRWREIVRPFSSVLYVSPEGDVEELRLLHAVCREEKKLLIPAMFYGQTGIAGPLVHPEREGCWESAWRRIHHAALAKDPQRHAPSATAGAMLANVIAFEWFKTATGAAESELENAVFLLNLETLEGSWHRFLPHPLVGDRALAVKPKPVQDLEERLGQRAAANRTNESFVLFSRLTSAQTGIFRMWEEGDLKQLPLSQCRVQAIDPLSEGPAELLADIVCSGLTHEEARKEAGLAGVEAYVSRLAGAIMEPRQRIGVGAGDSAAECVVRGLQACLALELEERQAHSNPAVAPVQVSEVEDGRCRFYLQSLAALRGEPVIGIGREVSGFPTVWVGTGDRWYGCASLNATMALRKALQAALQKEQNRSACRCPQVLEVSSVLLGRGAPVSMSVPAIAEQAEMLREAMQVFKKNGKTLEVIDLAVEPFLNDMPGGVYGVLLREEESW